MISKLVGFVSVFLILCTSSALCDHCTTEPDPAADSGFRKCPGHRTVKIITDRHAESLLKGHEYYQQLIYAKPASLKWDSDLQHQAQDWSNQCLYTSNGCRNFDTKYKKVYQLATYETHEPYGNSKFAKTVVKWFNDLATNESRRTSINFKAIDRIGCGFTTAMKSDCLSHTLPCDHGVISYLVCRYAATSEGINSPQ